MRNWLTLLAAIFASSAISINAMEPTSYLEFDAAYRHDSASWKFIIPSPDPLLENRLHFKDINIFQIGLQGKTEFDCNCCNLFVRAEADYGWILDGDVEESFVVFGAENTPPSPTDQRLEVQDILDGKYVADLSIGIGFPCYFCDCSFSLAPVIGYSYHTQHYKVDIHDRTFFQTTSAGTFITQEEDCCTNTFVNSWYGPFFGIDISYTPGDCLSLYGQFEYHLNHFTGKRSSNINVDPIDDYHNSTKKAHGAIVRLGLNYMFCDCWYAGLNATYMDFRSHKSHHVGNELAEAGFFPNIDNCCDKHIRDQVKLHSLAVGVAVGHTF